ncbi:Dual specificity tyrosine-phosphorylation-regulated kinase [Echinococcus granulosus]|uniref:Dual specificity tyrosine-phosphorylation-regulated kinase n=1 Tax=Echinococcus granulosus TaxID=6210 RepID=W6UHT8_ECHGR|nr:Dual specificity tyrosine-phosphorylation-regulated kinase [Echinococcus granulosus]EUB60631.1 Dual specificity tyrosine-phosphorylation-regulated kinase [Echinococcus granulosus]
MVNKPVQETADESQRRKIFSISKNSSKLDGTAKSNRLLAGGDKDEPPKRQVIYYQGENMPKESSKHMSFRLNGRKISKDTTYHEVPHDHIDYRYECIRSLGKGSFGNVILVIDHKEDKECALKVVRRDVRFTAQAKEEIAILELLQKANPNPKGSWDRYPIVRLIEHFMYHEHMCLSFELLGCSLYDLIKDKKDQGLPRDRVRRLMASVLDGLSYVWKAGIIHCDLKPENVLLVSRDADGGPDDIRDYVKIIDFGSSCFVGKQCYPYIQSRFYRAPEVIMRLDYGQPIDMWSFGCLIFEMIRGYPLFPGEDEFDQLACMMEKLGMPPWSMVGSSRVFSRYFYEVSGAIKYYKPQDRQTPLKFVPHYCTIRRVSEEVAELQHNLSKKTRRLRKPPGAVSVEHAIVSTLSHNSGKYSDYTPTSSEKMDNTHVVKLIEACLNWVPEKRINPDQAKTFSWFSYKPTHHNEHSQLAQLPRSTLFSSPSAALSKRFSDSSQVSLPAEIIPPHKAAVSNGGLATVVPIHAPPVSTIVPPSLHVNMAARNVANPMPLGNPLRVKNCLTSVSTPDFETSKKHGSSASISSDENKQEERVLYPRINKLQSPKSFIFEYNPGHGYNPGNLEKKVSDISLASHGSSIDDVASRTLDNLLYTKRNGVQMNERRLEPVARVRRRNQSMEPKRHTQPVGNEEVIEEQNILPSLGYTFSKTATRSSSSEDESESSGRHNPHSFNKTSQWDISAVDRRAGKAIDFGVPRRGSKADRRPTLTKTRSLLGREETLLQNNSDDSEMSFTRRPIYDNLRQPRWDNLRDLSKESRMKISPQQSTLPSINRPYAAKDGGVRLAQTHTDYRRRRIAGKSSSINQINDSRDLDLTNSHSNETMKVPHLPTAARLDDAVDRDSNNFMDLNKIPSSIMMIKPQT